MSREMIEEESTRESNFHALLSDLNYLQTRLEEEHEYELRNLESENHRLLAMNNYLAKQLNPQHTPGAPMAVIHCEKASNVSRPFVKRPRARRPPQLMLGADSANPAEPIADEYQFLASETNEWLSREATKGDADKDQPPQPAAPPNVLGRQEAKESHTRSVTLERQATKESQGTHSATFADDVEVTAERKERVDSYEERSVTASSSPWKPMKPRTTVMDGVRNMAESIRIRQSHRTAFTQFKAARDSETVEDELRKMRALIEDEEAEEQEMAMLRPGASICERCRFKALKITSSNEFEIFFAVAILLNSVFLGVEVDHTVTYPNTESPASFYIIGYFFTILFLVELIFRVTAHGKSFFYSGNYLWNYLDFFIVLASLVEVTADIAYFVSAGGNQAVGVSNVRIFRIIRITRLIRIFRVARIVKLIRALRTLVYQILGTLRAVFWAMILMLIIIYVFAMVFAQAASEHLIERPPSDGSQDNDVVIRTYWGSLPRSIFTLYKSIVGGVDWEIVVNPLSDIHEFWVMLFIIFISFTFFAVLNVVTGVFCQSAIESAQHDSDMVIQQHLSQKKMYIKKIRRLFQDMGEEGQVESITYRSLEKNLHEEKVHAYFESLGLDITDAWGLFKLLDVDESHQVELEEFVEGCLRLRGNAKAMDVAKISYDNKRYRKKLFSWMRNVDRILFALANANNLQTMDKSAADGHQRESAGVPSAEARYMSEIRQIVERKAPNGGVPVDYRKMFSSEPLGEFFRKTSVQAKAVDEEDSDKQDNDQR